MSKTNGTGNVSPAKAWRSLYEDGKEVLLPSGFTARLRSVSVGYLAKTGKMPDGLTAVALGAANIDITDPSTIEDDTLVETFTKLEEYYKVICQEAFVYPKVVDVDNPKGDDEIAYRWLNEADKQYVDALMREPVAEWERFRDRYFGSVEPVRED